MGGQRVELSRAPHKSTPQWALWAPCSSMLRSLIALLLPTAGGHPYLMSLGILGGIYTFDNPLQVGVKYLPSLCTDRAPQAHANGK